MLGFILKRLGLALLVALTVSAIAFLLLRLSGDVAVAIAGEGAQQADIDLIRQTYGLDRPIIVQYLDWLRKTLYGRFRHRRSISRPTSPRWSSTRCR